MRKKIAIIGSGFGGLAAAVRLAAVGHDVEVFEKLDKLGGRAYVFEQDGFKFDAGPTVVTAPFIFDEIWNLAGRKREDYFTLVPIDPFYRIFDHQGRPFGYNGDHEFILNEIRKFNPGDTEGYTRFIESTKAIFDSGMALIDSPFLHMTDMLRVAPDLIRLQSYRSVYGYVSQFVKDDFLRRCFSFHPLLIGGNPLDASSIYALIHYLEREWGVHYALGGTGTLVSAFGRLFEELGGRVHLNTEVRQIVVENGKAVGVRLPDGTVHKADAVVSNADLSWTYLNLIEPQHRKKNSDGHIKRLRHSMSLVVLYFGTKRRYTDTKLAHHNIILSENYKKLLHDIFANKGLPKDFSLYLHMPTKTDPSVAPPDHEAFYALSPIPHLGAGINWAEQAKSYRDTIMQFLEDNYLPDLQANIVTEHMVDPRYFQNTLNSYLGSGFSIQPILTQSAWFRPHNQSEDIQNLYFVGAGTHPGAGLPGVISSAKIAQDLIGPA